VGFAGMTLGIAGTWMTSDVAWQRVLDNIHWTFATTTAAVLSVLALRCSEPGSRHWRRWLASGWVAYALGQLVWDVQVAIDYNGFPSPSDFFYLLLGPCVIIGLWSGLSVMTTALQRRIIALDMLIFGSAGIMLVLALYLPRSGGTDLLSLAVLIAYPAALLAATAAALLTVISLRLRVTGYWLVFLIGLLATAVIWMIWNALALSGNTVDGSNFNAVFSIAIFALGWATPSIRFESWANPKWDRLCQAALRLLPTLAIAMAAATVVLVNSLPSIPGVVQGVGNYGAVIVTILSVMRQTGLVHERNQLLATEVDRARAIDALRVSEERWKFALNGAGDGMWDWDVASGQVWLSPRWKDMLGYGEDELQSNFAAWESLLDPEQKAATLMQLQDYLRGKIPAYQVEFRMRCKDGRWKWILARGTVIERDADGTPKRVIGTHTDIHARKEAQAALARSEAKYRTLFESVPLGIVYQDGRGHIVAANPAAESILGLTRDQLRGRSFADRAWNFIREDGAEFAAGEHPMLAIANATSAAANVVMGIVKPGTNPCTWIKVSAFPLPDARSDMEKSCAIFEDVTSNKEAEAIIWRQANYDELTGLPNRRMFTDRAAQEIIRARRYQTNLALLFIDLDYFKEVNDTLGHAAGDRLLVEAAQRLRSCVREADTVGRLGGDEFTVLLSQLPDKVCIDAVAESIVSTLAKPFTLGDESAYVSASIGITVYPNDAENVEQLFKNADQAMYFAKSQGRNRYSYFTASLQETANHRKRLTHDMRAALSGDQFSLHFQPIVELASGRVKKAEALLRWTHPTYGLMDTNGFIRLAEETGMINELGDWVFHEAARWAARWDKHVEGGFQVSINMSPVQFQGKSSSPARWIEYLQTLGLSGRGVALEITEGLLMDAESDVTDKLLCFRDAGVQVAIDDFGTGYSALAYLKKFDIDYLKIDRSFVHNLETDTDNLALSEAIVVMAHKLGLTVIAEGVETDDQSRLLRDMGCDYAQGYLYSRPVNSGAFERMLC
jgi:diguanylate cyclase (GGDEF)-like protein/PAS domain S-box-containing protein